MINGRDINNNPKPVTVIWDDTLGGYAMATTASFSGVTVEVDLNPTTTTVDGDGVFVGDPDDSTKKAAVVTDAGWTGGALQVVLAQGDIQVEVNLDPANDGVYLADQADNAVGVTDVGGDNGLNTHVLDAPVGYDDINDRYKFELEADSVGLATQATLSLIEGKVTQVKDSSSNEALVDASKDALQVVVENDAIGYDGTYGAWEFLRLSPTDVDSLIDTFTMSGSAEQITASATPIIGGVDLKNDKDNTGTVWVGFDNTVATNNGYPIYPGESKVFDVDDLSKLWINGTNTENLFYQAGA